MKATSAMYERATSAITRLLQNDLNTMVPGWAQGMIPAGIVSQIAPAIAKSAVDAALTAYVEPTPPSPAPPTAK